MAEPQKEFSLPKSQWSEGPWHDEPDLAVWPYHNLNCAAVRHASFGHFCGYVALPPGHPWYGHNEETIRDENDNYIDVHGGITYTTTSSEYLDRFEGVGAEDWCVGFDCGHYGDYQPGLRATLAYVNDKTGNLVSMPNLFQDQIYRTLNYVRWCTNRLAHLAYRAQLLEEISDGERKG
jgi:hypothetical protein